MNWLKDPRRRGYVALALLAVLALSVLAPLVIGRDARHLSAYRGGDEDMSRLRATLSGKAADVKDVYASPHALDDVAEPGKTLFLAVGTERRYDADEAQSVIAFLRAGGNVILADEGGFGTDVARAAGFAFGSQRVLQEKPDNYNGDPKLVVATATYGGQSYKLLFNSPSLLRQIDAGGDNETLVQSAAAASFPQGSYLDANGDGAIDQSDPAGPFPLVVRTHVGAGTLVLVADTGLFMNQHVDLPEFRNADFVAALAGDMIPRDGTILVDESRHASPFGLAPFDDAARALARATTGLVAPLVLLALLAGGAAIAWIATRKTEDWSHHAHDLGADVLSPENLRPDQARAQRMARRRISERYNIPMEQVAAMTAGDLFRLTGDKLLSDAAAGALKGDPAPLFRSFSSSATTPEGSP